MAKRANELVCCEGCGRDTSHSSHLCMSCRTQFGGFLRNTENKGRKAMKLANVQVAEGMGYGEYENDGPVLKRTLCNRDKTREDAFVMVF